jgi:hypothetical protein
MPLLTTTCRTLCLVGVIVAKVCLSGPQAGSQTGDRGQPIGIYILGFI